MPDKNELVLESIRKLLKLNVPDKEIILNLKEVGISEENANQLIKEAKKEPEKKTKPEKTDDEKDTEPFSEKVKNYGKKDDEISKLEDGQIAKLWEKGILTTANQRLKEMKEIQENFEGKISKEVEKGLEKEIKKINALLESKSILLSEKINSKMEEKELEVASVLNTKISELKKLGSQLKIDLEQVEKKTQENKLMLEKFKMLEEELKELKNSLIKEMNSELIQSKSDAQDFLESSKKRLEELDQRISKTLELQSNIVEGLIKEAEDKVSSIAVQKNTDLENEMKNKLSEMNELIKKLNPEKIDKKLKEFEQKAVETEKKISNMTEKTGKSMPEQTGKTEQINVQEWDEKMGKKIVEWDKRVSDKIHELETEIKGEIDYDSLRNTTHDLEIFKEKFIKTIEENTERLSKKLEQLNQEAQKAEQKTDSRIELIDKKIKELDVFEKKFAAEMNRIINSKK